MQGRREFLWQVVRLTLGMAGGAWMDGVRGAAPWWLPRDSRKSGAAMPVTLFLCGDVMLGRGIDQILAHPSDPVLYEDFIHDARGYLALAQKAGGPIPRKAAASYVWGEALTQWQQRRPDVRLINLETSITRHAQPWPKEINYRMDPANVGVLTAARIDCCALANNHVLDWGREGLAQTLATLRAAHIEVAGAGARLALARAPAVLPLAGGRRVLVFAAATGDAGVPETWAAGAEQSGVHRLPDLSADTVAGIAANVREHKRAGDVVVFSIHWGGNWGYPIAPAQRAFAHALIEEAGVDLLHGHSSHHPKAIEVHRGHLILYGCGDLLNDYEGIGGHDRYRGELGLMYFPRIDATDGRLRELSMVPTCIHRFRIGRPAEADRAWLLATLRRECRQLGCDVGEAADGAFALTW
jgi:poly-gamma-glutamate synthesis protein (capsule biosynthesis protein)